MNNYKQHPWFGLDDLGEEEISSLGYSDPKPLYNEKSQYDQDKALRNPEGSIDKDPDKPWVQGEDRPAREEISGVNKSNIGENSDPPADEWAQPEQKDHIPKPR